MKKIIAFSLLITAPFLGIFAYSPTTPNSGTQSKATNLTSAQKTLSAQQALEQETQNILKANISTKEAVSDLNKAKRAVKLGISPIIDVINETGKPLTLYGLDNGNAQKLMVLAAHGTPVQTVNIPIGVEFIYVESTKACTPVSLVNGLQALTIVTKNDIGSFSYTINPLVPQYGNHIFVYNSSKDPQTVVLAIENKSTIDNLKSFLGLSSSSSKTMSLVHTIPAQTSYVFSVPPVAKTNSLTPITISSVKFGTTNMKKPITVTPSLHNTFVIAPNGKLIQSK